MIVFTVIVTYNGMQWIDKCLKSLRNSLMESEVVIVDNRSNDGTSEHIQKLFPEIHLIRNTENFGFGKANNQGINFALEKGADHIFLLNQDAYVFPETIGELVKTQKLSPQNFVVCPILYQRDEQSFERHFSKLTDEKYCPGFREDLSRKNLKQFYEIVFLHAASWMLSRETVITVGGFDPLFSHNSEDNDFVNRVKFFNGRLVVSASARVVHDTNTLLMKTDLLKSEKRRRLYFVTNIAILKNINKTLGKCTFKMAVITFKSIILNTLHLRFSAVHDRLLTFGKGLIYLPQVNRHRKICRREGPTFLL